MHKEIGGYLELERFTGSMLHEKALALSSGRACLSYLIKQREIRKIVLPDYDCDVVEQTCRSLGVSIRHYTIGLDLRPENLAVEDDEWFYIVNYYGQLTREELLAYAADYPKLIVDNAQAYFDRPVQGVDTLYTCRKFLGVADGAFLYTDAPPGRYPVDESFQRMGFLLGRFERSAGEFFAEASRNNEVLPTEPRQMSALTKNLLHAVDYEQVKTRRTQNYQMLYNALGEYNLLSIRPVEGAYMYPLLLENGRQIRKRLIEKKIYVPTLWPNVIREQPKDSAAYQLADCLLPLPCDQRYDTEEMKYIIGAVRGCLAL